MTAADKRVQELLERWLASVELHATYLKLDDAAYARAKSWPEHQRPTRWVVELARTRLLELQAHLARRQAGGDTAFAEALELMSFLTTLLGSEHIERFIPLATGKVVDTGASGTVEQPRPSRQGPRSPAVRAARRSPAENVRRPDSGQSSRAAAQPPPPEPQSPAVTATRPPAKARVGAAAVTPAEQRMINLIIADAVRFLEWGREWPAVASQIARLADRPPETEIRSILRLYKNEIMQRAKRQVD
jgi:hypothetical protein